MYKLKIHINLATVILLFSTTLYSQNSFIKVRVIGIEEIRGNISIGLFNDSEGFPKRDENSIGIMLEITDSLVEHTFDHLSDGEYALAIYHDENSNGELDKNFLGIPSEDYVFSNYATGSFGPPSFEDSKFMLIDSLINELNILQ